MKHFKLLLIFFFILFTCAYNQGIKAKAIANSEVRLNLDSPVGNSSKYHYAIGENLTLYIDTKKDGYLYIINVEADNQSFLLSPNDFNAQNFYIYAGEHVLPPEGASYTFYVSEDTPLGLHKIIALVSPTTLEQAELAKLKAEFAGFTQQNALILQSGVAWGDASFYVNAANDSTANTPTPSAPFANTPDTPYSDQVNNNQLGGLVVNSLPSGASVLLDGQLRGQTPLAISAELGKHQVRVELSGYQPYETEVNLVPRQSTVLGLTLTGSINNPINDQLADQANSQVGDQADDQVEPSVISVSPSSPPQTNFGGLIVGSSPSGARIILNGQVFGYTPLSSSLAAGVYIIKIETNGYSSLERTIEILPSQTLEINEVLNPDTSTSYPQSQTDFPTSSTAETSQLSTAQLNTETPNITTASAVTSPTTIGLLEVPDLQVKAYPNSRIISQRNTENYFEAAFETNDTIQQTFSHFDEQLVNNGLKRRFQTSFFDIENNIYNVVYTLSSGKRITMILSHQQSKRLLELVFDGPERVAR